MANTDEFMNYTKHIKLLYVEDNKEARESTCMLFEYLFQSVVIAIDGEDGLKKFLECYYSEDNKKIDLIITDLNMPNMSGANMIKEIRKTDNLIPTIVLSAHDENEYIIDSIKRGASAYINKPIDIDELLKAIFEALHYDKRAKISMYNDEIVAKKYTQHINPHSIVTIFDPNGIILYVNESFAYLFGFPKEEIIGKPYYTLSKEKHDDELIEEIWQTIKIKKKMWSGTIRYVNNFDKVYFLRGTINPILDKNNNVIEFISIREDITDLVTQELKSYQGIK